MKKLSTREYIGVVVALVVMFSFLFFGQYIFGYRSNYSASGADSTVGANVADTSGEAVTASSGVVIKEVNVGTGEAVKAGDTISVNYTGMLSDGTKFDSSYDRGEPIKFVVGGGQIIKGFDEGVLGMKVGGKRNIKIPPELGYGAQQVGPIPANSTIVFDVELMKITE